MNRSLIRRSGIALVVVLLLFASARGGSETYETITLDAAVAAVTSGEVSEAELNERMASATLVVGDETVSVTYPRSYTETFTQLLLDNGVTVTGESGSPGLLAEVLISLLPILLIVALVVWYLRKSGSIGALKTDKVDEIPDVRFDDVAGATETVAELRELVEYLSDPSRFAVTGGTPSRGVLLLGPPGTGKTLLARAVAGEAGVPFFAISGSDFVEVFAGVGAKRVRDLFARARKAGKAIVFIDEIDAIGKARSNSKVSGTHDEREQALNALLVEMDGFTKTDVIVLGATNRSDVLDRALLRPGRFDRKIEVGLPDRGGREAILRLHAKDRPIGTDVDFASIGRRAVGMAGADLAQLVNEAALEAARAGRSEILSVDFDQALGTVTLGKERRSAVVTDEDRRITAWHEAGHAVAALLHPDAPDPVTVSIVPRGHAGGVTWMDGADSAYVSRRMAAARLVVAMGGRVGEQMLLDGEYTQGAEGDFQSATNLATQMVARWGMTDAGLYSFDLDYVEDRRLVREQVSALLNTAMGEARELLERHRTLVEAVAFALLEDETLNREQLDAIADQLAFDAAVS
jgi:cell division protease FtsH